MKGEGASAFAGASVLLVAALACRSGNSVIADGGIIDATAPKVAIVDAAPVDASAEFHARIVALGDHVEGRFAHANMTAIERAAKGKKDATDAGLPGDQWGTFAFVAAELPRDLDEAATVELAATRLRDALAIASDYAIDRLVMVTELLGEDGGGGTEVLSALSTKATTGAVNWKIASPKALATTFPERTAEATDVHSPFLFVGDRWRTAWRTWSGASERAAPSRAHVMKVCQDAADKSIPADATLPGIVSEDVLLGEQPTTSSRVCRWHSFYLDAKGAKHSFRCTLDVATSTASIAIE